MSILTSFSLNIYRPKYSNLGERLKTRDERGCNGLRYLSNHKSEGYASTTFHSPMVRFSKSNVTPILNNFFGEPSLAIVAEYGIK